MTDRTDLEKAIIRELDIPRDMTWGEVRRTIYPGKTLEEIWDSLWTKAPDPTEYLARKSG
jgi:hypothetical protein